MQIHEISVKGVRQMRWSPSGHVVAIAAGRDVILLSASNWKILTMLKVCARVSLFCVRNASVIKFLHQPRLYQQLGNSLLAEEANALFTKSDQCT